MVVTLRTLARGLIYASTDVGAGSDHILCAGNCWVFKRHFAHRHWIVLPMAPSSRSLSRAAPLSATGKPGRIGLVVVMGRMHNLVLLALLGLALLLVYGVIGWLAG